MTQTTVWLILAGLAVGAELATGTFYLLMFSVGLVAAGIAAYLGLSTASQIVTAAIVGGGCSLAWHFLKSGKEASAAAPANANSDVNMDIGATVHVDSWRPDGTTTVQYRGSVWQAIAFGTAAAKPGSHRIKKVIGSQLCLELIDQP